MSKGKETIKRFERGEPITGMEFHATAQDYFLERVWPEALEEIVTRQRSLGLGEPSDIHYQLVNPVKEEPFLLESDHLCRPITAEQRLSELAIDYYKGKILEEGQSSYLSRSEMERLEEARVLLRQEMR